MGDRLHIAVACFIKEVEPLRQRLINRDEKFYRKPADRDHFAKLWENSKGLSGETQSLLASERSVLAMCELALKELALVESLNRVLIGGSGLEDVQLIKKFIQRVGSITTQEDFLSLTHQVSKTKVVLDPHISSLDY